MNILQGWTHSFVYFNVNNLKNLLVANKGNTYFQNVKMLTKKRKKKSRWHKGGGCVCVCVCVAPQTPCLGKSQPKLRPWPRLSSINISTLLRLTGWHGGHAVIYTKFVRSIWKMSCIKSVDNVDNNHSSLLFCWQWR